MAWAVRLDLVEEFLGAAALSHWLDWGVLGEAEVLALVEWVGGIGSAGVGWGTFGLLEFLGWCWFFPRHTLRPRRINFIPKL